MVNNLTVGLVTFCNDKSQIERLVNSILFSGLNFQLIILDHSPRPLFEYLKNFGKEGEILYFHNPLNPGFGAGHNNAFNKALLKSEYHLIVNPDIYFDENILSELLKYLQKNDRIGILMPKICYPNGEIQNVVKLLPSPFVLLARRLLPAFLIKNINNLFELRNYDYTYVLDVPFLSGCFMIIKSDVFLKINGFDENIFMYTEDIDICRRTNELGYRTVIYPFVNVFHDHEVKSIFKYKSFVIFLSSFFYYFNKWGWFFDLTRKQTNFSTLELIDSKNGTKK